jgi:putative nucleotidyltransferase with HDIG domain
VLFIGGNPVWFHQAERDIYCLQPTWLCQRAENGARALDLMQSASFDALVLDGRAVNETDLQGDLQEKIRRSICLVRCDVSDRSAIARWNRSGITPVPEDGDAAALVAGLTRARRLRDWMAERAVQKLLSLVHKLPAVPRLHAQVTEQLRLPDASIRTVALLISQDPVMSAKILQVANSAFFGRAQEVNDAADAVMVLGTERVRSLILLAGVFSQYGDARSACFSPETIWDHSLQVAMFARAIAFAETKDARMAETAFTAGLLHDIGKLILAANVPEMYGAVQRVQASKKVSQQEAEQIMLGTTHAELGACLLGTWGLPLQILEAIAWHHVPERSTDNGLTLLAAVHVANVFAHADSQDGASDPIKLGFLLRVGLGDCRDRWREYCGIERKG